MTASITNSPGGCCCPGGFLGYNLGIQGFYKPNDFSGGVPDATWWEHHQDISTTTENYFDDVWDFTWPDAYTYYTISNGNVPTGFSVRDLLKQDMTQVADDSTAPITKVVDYSAISFPAGFTFDRVGTANGATESVVYLERSVGFGSAYTQAIVANAGGIVRDVDLTGRTTNTRPVLDDNNNLFTWNGYTISKNGVDWQTVGVLGGTASEAMVSIDSTPGSEVLIVAKDLKSGIGYRFELVTPASTTVIAPTHQDLTASQTWGSYNSNNFINGFHKSRFDDRVYFFHGISSGASNSSTYISAIENKSGEWVAWFAGVPSLSTNGVEGVPVLIPPSDRIP